MNEVVEKIATELYSLEPLKEFLGNDDEALYEVLEQFMESSKENLVFLENAVNERDIPEVGAIAHRIAPMFRQIEAHEISEILKVLEKNDFETNDLTTIWNSLKTKIDFLFEALNNEMV